MSSRSSDAGHGADAPRAAPDDAPDDAPDAAPAGYRSAAYAAALAHLGRPAPLGATGGHVLVRDIPGAGRRDLAGPYPLFDCTDWGALGPALEASLPGDPVTLTLVAGPFCPLAPETLAGMFDLCRPLHDHWLIDLSAPLAPSRHHRRRLRRAGPARIEAAALSARADPELTEGWVRLHETLAARKNITDLRAFPADSLVAQLAVPGAHLVTARDAAGGLIGADLYYLDRGVAQAHLSAYAPEGYAHAVSYPMIAAAAEHFRPLADVIDLGGAPAAEAGRQGGGVAHFKRGWASHSRPAHLCGRICDAAVHAALTGLDRPGAGWFPAYRAGEYAGPAGRGGGAG